MREKSYNLNTHKKLQTVVLDFSLSHKTYPSVECFAEKEKSSKFELSFALEIPTICQVL